MAGGYGVQIEDTVRVQLTTYQSAFAHWQRWQEIQPVQAPPRY
jgi:hypothetical protein